MNSQVESLTAERAKLNSQLRDIQSALTEIQSRCPHQRVSHKEHTNFGWRYHENNCAECGLLLNIGTSYDETGKPDVSIDVDWKEAVEKGWVK
jgi:hypothetical protein